MNQESPAELLAKVKECAIYIFKEVLTLEEAAQYMGLKKSYLYKLTMRREIPHYKPNGKMCYFKRAELVAWLTDNRVATAAELDDAAARYCQTNKNKK